MNAIIYQVDHSQYGEKLKVCTATFGDYIIAPFFLPEHFKLDTSLDLLENPLKPALIEMLENEQR